MDDRVRKRILLSRKTALRPAPAQRAHFSKYRAAEASAVRLRRNLRDRSSSSSSRARRLEKRRPLCPPDISTPTRRPIVMLRVGPQQRLFAAHESILSASPFFANQCSSQTPSPPCPPHIITPSKRIDLPNETPEVLSCVLEYLYKGDYSPRLQHDPNTGVWSLADDILPRTTSTTNTGVGASASSSLSPNAVIWHHAADAPILRDTAVYCAALTYQLPSLARLALRKQGLHMGIPCRTILASARFAYAHTPDTESRLRAHYLALIVRCRGTFKKSGTMQAEMERGGRLFFDLFVAMCNHMDDVFPSAMSVCSSAMPEHGQFGR